MYFEFSLVLHSCLNSESQVVRYSWRLHCLLPLSVVALWTVVLLHYKLMNKVVHIQRMLIQHVKGNLHNKWCLFVMLNTHKSWLVGLWSNLISRSSSKLNHFVLVTHPTCPLSSVRIRPYFFEISWCISFLAWSIVKNLNRLKYLYPDVDPDLHQNRINSSLSHTKPVHQISSESVHNFLRYPAHRQTERWKRNPVHLRWLR